MPSLSLSSTASTRAFAGTGRRRGLARPRKVPAVCASVDVVLDALIREYVCPVVARCAGLGVGDAGHQHAVLSAFADLAHTYRMDHGQGHVLRALLADDPWTAMRLAHALDQYNRALEVIGEAVSSLPELPADRGV